MYKILIGDYKLFGHKHQIKRINYCCFAYRNHFHFPFTFSYRYSFLPQISISIGEPVGKLIMLGLTAHYCYRHLSDKMIFCLKLWVLTEYIELIHYSCVCVCVCAMNISLLNKYVSVSSCVYHLVNGNLNRSLPFVAICHLVNFVTALTHIHFEPVAKLKCMCDVRVIWPRSMIAHHHYHHRSVVQSL